MLSSKRTANSTVDRKLLTAKPQTVRHLNRAAVLDLIQRYQPLSRADLARHTGIHRSNISIIVADLQNEGLLREERSSAADRGRTPHLLSLDRGSFGVVGVSLRRAKTTLALASLDAQVESSFTFETPDQPSDFLDKLEEAFRTVTVQLGNRSETRREVRQMVISIPGIVTRLPKGKTEIWTPGLPQYSGWDISEAVRKRLGVPTTAANNAGLGAMASMHSAQKANQAPTGDFVFLVVGDVGVGSGLVMQRSLYSGFDAAYAGEVGHTVIDPAGPQCNCGRRGCWQLYVCDTATLKRYDPKLKFSAARFGEFIAEVNAGSPKALKALRKTAEFLSLGLSNIALMVNPERIIIAGALANAWPVLEKELKSSSFLPHHRTIIEPMTTSVDTLFLRGAIDSALQQVFFEGSNETSFPKR
jgi:predicted NBD/HSP70 family sugar kinase